MSSRWIQAVISTAFLTVGCGSNADPGLAAGQTGEGGSAATTGGTSTTSSGGSAVQASGGSSPSGGAGGTTQNGAGGSGGTSVVYQPGSPGCGFDAAAFCETFDAPAGAVTRAGELDPLKWSAARMCDIGGPTDADEAVAVGPATVPTCRGDLPAQIFPNQDAVICDPSDTIQSNHLMVLVAAQNYGQNSYRIRQPIDFADRTAKIVFDAEGYNTGLLGWISLEITEEPTPAPSFTLLHNFENGAVPQNGLELQFDYGAGGNTVGIVDLLEYDDFAQSAVFDGLSNALFVPGAQGKLNHFEVQLSQNHVDVYATPPSDDGVTFGEPVLIASADLNLGFTRGYVHLTTHNHATMKYSENTVDAWVARWDNVGFDGPAVVGAFREYEAPDSLTTTGSGMTNVAYRLNDAASGPAQTIEIPGVDLTGATGARLALENWSYYIPGDPAPSDYALNYRLNGHAWHARTLNDSELTMMTTLENAGTRSLMIDLDLAELTAGTNTLELTTTNAKPPLVPVALNIDLILKTQ